MNSSTEEVVSTELKAVNHKCTCKIKGLENWPNTTKDFMINQFSMEVSNKNINCCIKFEREVDEQELKFLEDYGEIDYVEDTLYTDSLSFLTTFNNDKELLKSTKIHIKICVYNNQKQVYKEIDKWQEIRQGQVCLPGFLNHSFILNPDNNLLLENTLTMVVEITIPTNFLRETDQLTIPREVEFKILSDLESILKNPVHSDLIITASCGQKFYVHKSILAARSTLFRTMFEIEENENDAHVTDVDGETVQGMLTFIYTGKIDFSSYDPVDVLKLADKYGIDDLKQMSESIVSKNITIENAVDLFITADRFSAKKLKKICSKFIRKNKTEVVNTDSFKSLINPESSVNVYLSQIIDL